MKFKPKSTLIAAAFLLLAAAGATIASWAGFSANRSALRVGYFGRGGWESWSASYMLLDGTMQKTLRPGQSLLRVEAETGSGVLSIELQDKDGTPIFSQVEMGNSSFDIETPETVIVRITADGHQGRFSIGPP